MPCVGRRETVQCSFGARVSQPAGGGSGTSVTSWIRGMARGNRSLPGCVQRLQPLTELGGRSASREHADRIADAHAAGLDHAPVDAAAILVAGRRSLHEDERVLPEAALELHAAVVRLAR